MTTTPATAPTHTTSCVSYALNLAEESGAESLAQAAEWVTGWEADGGLDNYGACTCYRFEGVEVSRTTVAAHLATIL